MRGVRQGCILSPLLFNLYINNLIYAFQNAFLDPIILPNGTKLNSLFYADDLIILSRSKVRLQNCLNTLYSFSISWMLDISSKKTKIMIFQKRAKKNSDLEFHIGKQNIDIVLEYTYLGIRISSTGNFNVSLEHLKEKALHALFGLRKNTDISRLEPSLACKIFDTVITPILSYNCEIWGAYQKQDFKTWDSSPNEKTHSHFCKRYLEVSNKASNAACRGELGRFPLIVGINEKILNCIMYLFAIEKDEDSIGKQALLLSINLNSNGNTSFYSNIMELSKSYNLPNFVPNNLDKTKISRYKDIMKQKYITQWRYSVNYTRKLEFYNTFKHCYEISSYLKLTKKQSIERLW